ncbi:BtpA family protein [uncultured archaeon]|nr:BtpA family protein [uncultured archaeon]
MLDITKTFDTSKPIIAMVHMQDCGDIERTKDAAIADSEKLIRGGVDGLLFENWNLDGYVAKEPMIEIMREVSKIANMPTGVNVLPFEYEIAFEVAKVSGADFVQLDTFVDKLKTSYYGNNVIEIDPLKVMQARKDMGLKDVALVVNLQTKHYWTEPITKTLETSAMEAIRNGADALVVTGSITGAKTPKEKLYKVNAVCRDTPVFIGSGLDESNVEELLPLADGAIVGTSLKAGGITENQVDSDRVRRLMSVVHQIRRQVV